MSSAHLRQVANGSSVGIFVNIHILAGVGTIVGRVAKGCADLLYDILPIRLKEARRFGYFTASQTRLVPGSQIPRTLASLSEVKLILPSKRRFSFQN